MRGLLAVAGMLITLAVVGVLFKKQMATPANGKLPSGELSQMQSTQPQSLQAPTQVKQALDAALQTPRAAPDDK